MSELSEQSRIQLILSATYLSDDSLRKGSCSDPKVCKGILYLIKSYKGYEFQNIPSRLMPLVNKTTICLLTLAKMAPEKVLQFALFWLEKLEMSIDEEEQHEYQKFVLRNSICNLNFLLSDFESCLQNSNTNIREISCTVRRLLTSASSFGQEQGFARNGETYVHRHHLQA